MFACKWVFTFSKKFETVLFFAHMHLKFAKGSNKTNSLPYKFNYGYQKTQNLMLIKNSFKWFQKKLLKKLS